jgi:hypothetical protein
VLDDHDPGSPRRRVDEPAQAGGVGVDEDRVVATIWKAGWNFSERVAFAPSR